MSIHQHLTDDEWTVAYLLYLAHAKVLPGTEGLPWPLPLEAWIHGGVLLMREHGYDEFSAITFSSKEDREMNFQEAFDSLPPQVQEILTGRFRLDLRVLQCEEWMKAHPKFRSSTLSDLLRRFKNILADLVPDGETAHDTMLN